MSAPIAKSQFAFELPNLSYVDASLEEPNLRVIPQRAVEPHGFGAWLTGRVAAYVARRKHLAALAELEMMTDHELMDVGLTRGDIDRVFDVDHNRDLVRRNASV